MTAAPEPAETHRFLLELWLEPRVIASRLRRLRGRMRDLGSDEQRAVAGLADVDELVKGSFDLGPEEIEWEVER